MPRLNPTDKKATLLKKQEQIAAQLRQLSAREKENHRKVDTRRKVIAGALALEHFSQNPSSEFARALFKLLDEHVEDRSRHLFAFLPAKEPAHPANMAANDSAAPPGPVSVSAAARATTAPG